MEHLPPPVHFTPHNISRLKLNETLTWCNTVEVLFLQSHSTCFGRKRPSSGVFKTSTAATGTCVIVAGQSSHLLIRALNVLSQMKHQLDTTLCKFYFCRVTLHVSGASAHHQEYLKLVQRPLVHVLLLMMMGACTRNMQSDPAEIKPAQCCIKLVFHLTYTVMHGSTKLKFHGCLYSVINVWLPVLPF